MPKLKTLYEQMVNLTKPKCGKCNVPHGCCSREHYEEVKSYAKKEYDILLEPTIHPTLPFMGTNGCIVEPYLRPICSVHVCEKWYMTDLEFREKYFDLREQICEEEDCRSII